jgi:hypothetical protein
MKPHSIRARRLDSILRQFLDRGFSGWWAGNWASAIPWLTKNSQSYVI